MNETGVASFTVWKIPVPWVVNQGQYIAVPVGAEILSVGKQSTEDEDYGWRLVEMVVIWVRCDPTVEETEQRGIVLVETGKAAPAPHIARHVGTVMLYDGTYVLHLFEKIGGQSE